MLYTIEHEARGSIRIRIGCGRIRKEEAEVLRYALAHLSGVGEVTFFSATGSIRLTYTCPQAYLLEKLNSLRYENVELFAREISTKISREELAERKLSPGLKRRLRARLLAETVADVFLPMPVQVAYHVYQMVTLKEL